jgi:hypothetical protein
MDEPIKKIMTPEEVEAWVMLKGQSDERWFEIRVLDPDMQDEPNLMSLMQVVSDMIFRGIKEMPFIEANSGLADETKPNIKIVTKGH